MPKITIQKNPSGMFELLQDGKRISTGTQEAISQMANRLGGSAGGTPTATKTDPIADSGIRRHITPAEPELAGEIGKLDRTAPTPLEETGIREQETERVQSRIDVINEIFQGLISREEVAGKGRLGEARAISARAGVLGGEFGAQRKRGEEEFTKEQIESIRLQQSARINEVLSKAEDRASKKIEAERDLALKNREAFIEFQKDKISEAREDLKTIAKSGLSLADLSDEEYKTLLEDTEMTPFMFDAVYNANLPANQKQEYSYINVGGGKIVRVNQAGGEPEEFDFSTPEGFEFKMAGDVPIFYNKETQEVVVADLIGDGGDIKDLDKDKKLSINQIEQFRRSFGWTPPFGYTMGQLDKYISDNPGATPEELELGARQVADITTAKTEEKMTPDTVINKITSGMTDEQLKKLKEKSDEAGISSFFKSKETDVENYLNSIKDKIQSAIDNGFSIDEIINFLTQ